MSSPLLFIQFNVVKLLFRCLLMPCSTFIYKETYDKDGEDNTSESYFVAIFVDLLEKLFFCFDTWYFGQVMSDRGKNGIPYART